MLRNAMTRTDLPDWSAIDTVLLDLDGTLLDLAFDTRFWRHTIPSAWAQARGRVLADPRFARHLGERGQAVAAGCTWACSAERTLALLTRVARSAGVTAGEGNG